MRRGFPLGDRAFCLSELALNTLPPNALILVTCRFNRNIEIYSKLSGSLQTADLMGCCTIRDGEIVP